jgi:uncharacterized membrane protein
VSNEVSEDIVVHASTDEVMEVIADFETYPDWQSEMKEAEVLETDEDGWGTKARFLLDAGILQARFTLVYTYTEYEMRWRLVDGDKLRRNDGVYALEDLGDGTTRVTYRVDVEPTVPIPAVLRRKAAQRVVHSALRDLKHRVEG